MDRLLHAFGYFTFGTKLDVAEEVRSKEEVLKKRKDLIGWVSALLLQKVE